MKETMELSGKRRITKHRMEKTSGQLLWVNGLRMNSKVYKKEKGV